MADVRVRELKQRLSAYLTRAEHGEVLRITKRGRPKAIHSHRCQVASASKRELPKAG